MAAPRLIVLVATSGGRRTDTFACTEGELVHLANTCGGRDCTCPGRSLFTGFGTHLDTNTALVTERAMTRAEYITALRHSYRLELDVEDDAQDLLDIAASFVIGDVIERQPLPGDCERFVSRT